MVSKRAFMIWIILVFILTSIGFYTWIEGVKIALPTKKVMVERSIKIKGIYRHEKL